MNILKGFASSRYVNLEQHKQPAFSAPLDYVPLVSPAYIPLYDPCGGNIQPVVRPGDKCARFSLLARTKTPVNSVGPSWIMSPLSGYVDDIIGIDHPIIGKTLCVVISPDDSIPSLHVTGHNLSEMTENGILRIIHQAGIIDEFDGRSLIDKILEAKEENIHDVTGIALDDSPYVSSALKTVNEFSHEISDGFSVILEALGGGSASLAVYDCDELKLDLDGERFGFINVIKMKGGFPLISKFKRHYHSDGHFLPIGVQALRSVAHALVRGIPQTNSIITVSGDCIKRPCNAVVVNGTLIEDVLRFVGVNRLPKYVIVGDTMSGTAVTDIRTPIIAGMRAITVMHSLPYADTQSSCTRCGKCVAVCPMDLMPYEAVRLCEKGEYKRAAKYGAEHCTGCGACSAVCPSSLEVAAIMRRLKSDMIRKDK